MRTWMTYFAVALLPVLAVTAAVCPAAELDLKRYMPVSEIQVGMTGAGKTTLEGATLVDFQVRVLAVVKNAGPKRDLIIVRCGGAGLEESGVIAGMSGSPVYINGRLIGAVAYAFPWCKLPLAGIQPIEQMLSISDESPWNDSPLSTRGRGVGGEGGICGEPFPSPGLRPPSPTRGEGTAEEHGYAVAPESNPRDLSLGVPVAALGVADLPAPPAGIDASRMMPIATPVMVSGLSGPALERLRSRLAPLGMAAMQGGEADAAASAAALLVPGAPLAVPLVRGDIKIATMGTITEIVGDRLYAFGHNMLSIGETNLPVMTGIAHVVIPSLQNSFRLGAPVKEVGRMAWDEETGVLCRLGKERAPLVPVTVKIVGPAKGVERVFRCEMVHHRLLSPLVVGEVIGGAITARSDLPRDHTLTYRVTVKSAGREPIVRKNVTASPNGDAYVAAQARQVVGLLMENPFRNQKVESVDVEITVEAASRMAEIQEVRPLRNAVRPGESVPVEVKIRPWRSDPEWITVDVAVPADYPEGPARVTICGADEARRQEAREAPARFRPDSVETLVDLLRRDYLRDRLFVRLAAPGQGLSIGDAELPNLPDGMRSVLSEAARRQVTGLTGAIVTQKPMFYVLQGSADLTITVDRKAAKH